MNETHKLEEKALIINQIVKIDSNIKNYNVLLNNNNLSTGSQIDLDIKVKQQINIRYKWNLGSK